MAKTAVILMTALVPTVGHKALIDYALQLVGKDGYVDVIISGRSFEPVETSERIDAFAMHYRSQRIYNVYFIAHDDDNAPQNPSTVEEWNYWKNLIVAQNDQYDYFVASEPYGQKMAELIGAEFMPFDIDRNIVISKGTEVRKQIDWNFNKLLPEFAKKYQKTITFFGQESCGKTTMTKEMYLNYDSIMIHEFARPYLENMVDKSITSDKMNRIVEGQYALQKYAHTHLDCKYIFQDTDLLSTLGYYRIYNEKFGGLVCDHDIGSMIQETKSDLYIVMNDEIPFEEDDLRYGGKERESTKQFWIDLLEEFGCNYYVLKETEFLKQYDELYPVIDDLFDRGWKAIKEFERD